MNKMKWQEKQFDSLGYHEIKVKRTLFVDKYPDPKHKYKEKVDFLDVEGDKPCAICLGFNPAKAEENLDDTNKRLIDALKDRYCGYHLFNLHHQIESDQTNIKTIDVEFIKSICRKINGEALKELDIVLFFGRLAVIPEVLVKYLKKWSFKEHRKVYITAHGDEFTHPSANAKIELKEFKTEYLRKETVIRIKRRERTWQK